MTDSTEDKRAIAALEDARAAAIVNADVGVLDALTDADYVHVEVSGRVRTKAEFLETLRLGGRFERYEVSDNLIRLYGDAAVVTGEFRNALRLADGGLAAKHARHVRLYVRRAEGWMNVLHQATALDGVTRAP